MIQSKAVNDSICREYFYCFKESGSYWESEVRFVKTFWKCLGDLKFCFKIEFRKSQIEFFMWQKNYINDILERNTASSLLELGIWLTKRGISIQGINWSINVYLAVCSRPNIAYMLASLERNDEYGIALQENFVDADWANCLYMIGSRILLMFLCLVVVQGHRNQETREQWNYRIRKRSVWG